MLQASCSNLLRPPDFSQPSPWFTYFTAPFLNQPFSACGSPLPAKLQACVSQFAVIQPALYCLDVFKPRQRSGAARLLSETHNVPFIMADHCYNETSNLFRNSQHRSVPHLSFALPMDLICEIVQINC